ncbi:MAG: hypothetical protein AABZ31_14640, partial [Bdellovibrionota bacterium]
MRLIEELELRHKICFPVLIFIGAFTGDCGPEEAIAKPTRRSSSSSCVVEVSASSLAECPSLADI